MKEFMVLHYIHTRLQIIVLLVSSARKYVDYYNLELGSKILKVQCRNPYIAKLLFCGFIQFTYLWRGVQGYLSRRGLFFLLFYIFTHYLYFFIITGSVCTAICQCLTMSVSISKNCWFLCSLSSNIFIFFFPSSLCQLPLHSIRTP